MGSGDKNEMDLALAAKVGSERRSDTKHPPPIEGNSESVCKT